MDHYRILGVKPDANKDEITKAYKNKAKYLHPDKGGNTDDFAMLNRAYATLTNDENREYYDSTGDDQPANNTKEQALESLFNLLNSMVEQDVPLNIDIVEVMRQEIVKNIQLRDSELAKIRHQIIKINKIKDKLKISKGVNSLNIMLRKKIQDLKIKEHAIKSKKDMLNKMTKILEDYSFEVEGTEWIGMRILNISTSESNST